MFIRKSIMCKVIWVVIIYKFERKGSLKDAPYRAFIGTTAAIWIQPSRSGMYVCISLYSLPFTGFESLPESVQTNLSKITQKPPSNLPRDMEPLPWRSLTALWWDLQFKVGSEPPRASVEVLRKYPLVPAQGLNPEPPAWKSGVLPPEPPVLSRSGT